MDIEALDKKVEALRKFLDEEADGATSRGGVRGLAGLRLRAENLQREARTEGINITDSGAVEWQVMYDRNAPDAPIPGWPGASSSSTRTSTTPVRADSPAGGATPGRTAGPDRVQVRTSAGSARSRWTGVSMEW
ncbi:hypothetical protein ACWCXS_17645 [Streptomyces sp. NPDC001685]